MGTDVGTGVTGVRAGVQWADAGRMGGTERGVLRGLWDGGDLSNLPCLVGDQPSCHHHCPPPQNKAKPFPFSFSRVGGSRLLPDIMCPGWGPFIRF